MASAASTTDHNVILRWVEPRGGCPAHVTGSGSQRDRARDVPKQTRAAVVQF
jgi:hypothetical protein